MRSQYGPGNLMWRLLWFMAMTFIGSIGGFGTNWMTMASESAYLTDTQRVCHVRFASLVWWAD
jgi:hypothetical protein